jgi:putative acetyltransferase
MTKEAAAMETLVTTRMLLRGWAPEDADDLFMIAGNPNVAAGAGWKPLGSREEAAELIGRYSARGDVWALEHRLHHRIIGVIGLSDDAFRPEMIRCKMLTVSLAEEFWGSGYAGEAAKVLLKHAFLQMKLDFVTANHFNSNTRSKRVLEKCGFACEGTLRRALLLWNGEIRDAVSYSILREEFKKLPVTRREK